MHASFFGTALASAESSDSVSMCSVSAPVARSDHHRLRMCQAVAASLEYLYAPGPRPSQYAQLPSALGRTLGLNARELGVARLS